MRRTLPGHANCRHRYYGLNCDLYEQMLEETGQRCEICGSPPQGNTAGKLFIDHDNAIGIWAVRGLLCHRCNSLIADKPGWGAVPPNGHQEYLHRPWYVRQAHALGVALDLPPEPALTAQVLDPHGRTWRHTWMGWRARDGRARSRTWAWLANQFGPIGLTITD